ncbi:MAG: hypothetical protein M3Z92_06925 [Bacteroidota bacterium]|nr:hypothetical protein [Bacteroidota bacterium]
MNDFSYLIANSVTLGKIYADQASSITSRLCIKSIIVVKQMNSEGTKTIDAGVMD